MRLVVALALLSAVPARATERIAIASFELVGSSSAELKRALRGSLAGGLAVAGLDVVPETELARRAGGVAGCDTMSCLHKLAELAGVKTVVKARVEVLGSNYVFVLDRIDPLLERAIAHVDENCQVCTTAEASDAMSNAARKVGGAPANPDEARARALDATAAAAYTAGRFEEAARGFEEAYALSKRTPLLWNIAQSYRRQYEIDRDPAKLRRARVVLRNLLGLSPPPDQRREAEEMAAEIDRELARPVVAPTTEAPQKPPLHRRWQLWLGVGLGVAAVIAVGVGLGVGLSGGTDVWQSASNRCGPGCSVVDLRP